MGDNSNLGIDADARIPILVGITGHRNLEPSYAGGPGTGLYRAVRGKLLAMKQVPEKKASRSLKAQSYPHSPLVLMSCLAEGADQLALAAALGLEWDGVKWVEREPALVEGFVAVLPLPVALLETDFDPAHGSALYPDSLARFRGLLARATSVIPMYEFPNLPFARADITAAEHDPEIRRVYYGLAGEYLARRCHVLLALWDGVEPAPVPVRSGNPAPGLPAQSDAPVHENNGDGAKATEPKPPVAVAKAAPVRGESTLAAMRIKAGGRPLGPALSLGLRPPSTWPYLPDIHPIQPPEPGLVWQVIAPRPHQHHPSATETFVPYVWTHPLDIPPMPKDHDTHAPAKAHTHHHSHSNTRPDSVGPHHDSKVQAIIAEMDEYNRRLFKYAPQIPANKRSFPLTMAGQKEFAPLRTQYHNADCLAMHFQDRAEEGVWFLFRLGCVAAVAFVCYAKLFVDPYKYLALGAYILAFAYAGARIQQLRWQQARRLHEACRSFAEALRVQLAWRVARVPHLVSDHYLQRYRGDVLWVRRAIDGLLLLHPPTPAKLDRASADQVHDGWIKNQQGWLMDNKVTINLAKPQERTLALIYHCRVAALLSCSVLVAVGLALLKGWLAVRKGFATSGGGAPSEAAHYLHPFFGSLVLLSGLAAAGAIGCLVWNKWRKLQQEKIHDSVVAELETRTLWMVSVGAIGLSGLAIAVIVALSKVPSISKYIIEDNLPYAVWGSCIGMLITLAGLIHFVSDKMAYREHAANYEVAAAVFTRASIDMEQNLNKQPWGQEQAAEFQEQVLRLGREALAENTRWVTVQRSKPLDLPHVH